MMKIVEKLGNSNRERAEKLMIILVITFIILTFLCIFIGKWVLMFVGLALVWFFLILGRILDKKFSKKEEIPEILPEENI
jgi:uncharacterized membrane protein